MMKLSGVILLRGQKLTGKRSYSIDYGKTFDKILVANRGEIACRIMKTAKKMGIKTAAVYSEADSHSLHVEMADEAICVGPPPTSQSYLNIESILEAIRKTGAQAVHPGYGFLSENFKFCQALDEHHVTFIGPSVEAMAKMGDKIESKIIAKDAGVHTIPGFNGVVESIEQAISIGTIYEFLLALILLANEIKYPVMIKASAGGGGKGMRIAWNDEDVARNFKIAATESKASFGDDRLLIEKYIEEPRHVEIQILGDRHGNIVYLPERECSIQRRNQKVIEEAPSMAIDEATRKMMGEQAVSLARKVGYSSAGTVEFLVDKNRHFYFLEMNTRLQVEHPITEYITGIDLVEQMIRVAANQRLQIKQSDVRIKGWAFESRVYAEDPKLFLPSIGKLEKYIEPRSNASDGKDVRCDSGVKEGSEISIYYDPLICKLCTHGSDRSSALAKMQQALDSYVIRGVTHNIPVIREVMSQKRFQEGRITTKYLVEEFPDGGFNGHQLSEQEQTYVSIAATYIYDRQQEAAGFTGNKERLFIAINGTEKEIVMGADRAPSFITVNGATATKVHKIKADWKASAPMLTLSIDGTPITMQYHGSSHVGNLSLQAFGTVYSITVQTALERQLSKYLPISSSTTSERFVKAPMAGQIVSTPVKEGDVVREGGELLVIEAMKMQNVLRAPKSVKIVKLNVKQGQNVVSDQVLVELEFL